MDPPLPVVRMDVSGGDETVRGEPASAAPAECTVQGNPSSEQGQTTPPEENDCRLSGFKRPFSRVAASIVVESPCQGRAWHYDTAGSLSP